MPLYVYAVVRPDGSDGPAFEWLQGLNEAELKFHAATGEPVRKLPTSCRTIGRYGAAATAAQLSRANLERLGLSQYQRAGDGYYEKSAGFGPQVIHKDRPVSP